MRQVRTAKGRVLDMASLAKANEEVKAISPGNVTLNARGDEVDRAGNVIRTVQAKSKAAHNTTSAPERTKLSDAPGAPKKKSVSKKNTTKEPEIGVARQEEKTRDDGTRYLEIEYDDGSMETKELDE